jgi:tetratricopeptide (TPR) repeat protein
MVNSANVEKRDLAVNAARGEDSQPRQATLIFGKAAFAVLIVLAGFGLILCLPIPRAWLLALCGNYAAATEIYENQLARKPNHLPLYLTLANLYLLAGRRDERALIAYRVVCQLRMATQHLQASKRFDLSQRQKISRFPQSPGFEATTEHSCDDIVYKNTSIIFGCEGNRQLEAAVYRDSSDAPSESVLHPSEFQ